MRTGFDDAQQPFEFDKDYSPMWRDVMVHAHWTEALAELARGYLRRLFRLPDTATIPPVRTTFYFPSSQRHSNR